MRRAKFREKLKRQRECGGNTHLYKRHTGALGVNVERLQRISFHMISRYGMSIFPFCRFPAEHGSNHPSLIFGQAFCEIPLHSNPGARLRHVRRLIKGEWEEQKAPGWGLSMREGNSAAHDGAQIHLSTGLDHDA
jgi:hypothetical protein